MRKANNMEKTALELKATLTCLSAIDPDNIEACQELPIVLERCKDLAEQIYCVLIDDKSK